VHRGETVGKEGGGVRISAAHCGMSTRRKFVEVMYMMVYLCEKDCKISQGGNSMRGGGRRNVWVCKVDTRLT